MQAHKNIEDIGLNDDDNNKGKDDNSNKGDNDDKGISALGLEENDNKLLCRLKSLMIS